MKIRKQSPTENAVGCENHISFGFAYLHDVSYTDCKKVSFFIDYLQRLKKICGIDWKTVNISQRHAIGCEKIPVTAIKKDLKLTREVTFLLAFRATGDNHAFLGFRDGNIFQVVYIEAEFGDIYNH